MILDQYANPVSSSRFLHGADTRRTRGPQFQVSSKSLEELISSYDRTIVVSLCNRLFFNLGPVRAVNTQRANYTVGEAFEASYNGVDQEEGDQIEEWLKVSFFPSMDVRGQEWGWHDNLKEVSLDVDNFGESFTLLTESEDGFPMKRRICPFAIHAKGDRHEITSGRYQGAKMRQGIITDKRGRVIAYRVSTGCDIDEFEDIPAASIIHVFDPTRFDGGRGLPLAVHAIDALKHVMQSTEYESIRQFILTTVGLLVENETGSVDPGDPSNLFAEPENQKDLELVAEHLSPQLWYAKTGEGKISQIKHETGGDSFESFHDRLIRSYIVGAGWSNSLAWKHEPNGTAERAEILQARAAISANHQRLSKWAKRLVSYAVAKRGTLDATFPTLQQPHMWSFSKPPRLSVDDGREAKLTMEMHKSGYLNQRDVIETLGNNNYEEFLINRSDEIRKRWEQIYALRNEGIPAVERDFLMMTPNEKRED